MGDVKLKTGLLTGEELREFTVDQLNEFAHSEQRELTKVSFYKNTLTRGTFRGVKFSLCSFSKSTFENVVFRKCRFEKVDMTRCRFVQCYFSDCDFVNCDPYYASFPETVIEPAAFRKCYRSGESNINKALLLFSELKKNLDAAGDHPASRAADYYYRRWQRRLFYHRWRFREASGVMPWLRSFLLSWLTGYGERPMNVMGWIFALITCMAVVYRYYFPGVLPQATRTFLGYWYFSFKIFCAKGFTDTVLSRGAVLAQVSEFTVGLVFLALLVASITRKLS